MLSIFKHLNDGSEDDDSNTSNNHNNNALQRRLSASRTGTTSRRMAGSNRARRNLTTVMGMSRRNTHHQRRKRRSFFTRNFPQNNSEQRNLPHDVVCDFCGVACLDPTNEEQRREHIEHCVKDLQKDIETSSAIIKSKDKMCGICLEKVMEKPPDDRQFGILTNCNHCFCLSCIRTWRRTQLLNSSSQPSCPECRMISNFIIPNLYWVETLEEKRKLAEEYRRKYNVEVLNSSSGDETYRTASDVELHSSSEGGMSENDEELLDRIRRENVLLERQFSPTGIETFMISGSRSDGLMTYPGTCHNVIPRSHEHMSRNSENGIGSSFPSGPEATSWITPRRIRNVDDLLNTMTEDVVSQMRSSRLHGDVTTSHHHGHQYHHHQDGREGSGREDVSDTSRCQYIDYLLDEILRDMKSMLQRYRHVSSLTEIRHDVGDCLLTNRPTNDLTPTQHIEQLLEDILRDMDDVVLRFRTIDRLALNRIRTSAQPSFPLQQESIELNRNNNSNSDPPRRSRSNSNNTEEAIHLSGNSETEGPPTNILGSISSTRNSHQERVRARDLFHNHYNISDSNSNASENRSTQSEIDEILRGTNMDIFIDRELRNVSATSNVTGNTNPVNRDTQRIHLGGAQSRNQLDCSPSAPPSSLSNIELNNTLNSSSSNNTIISDRTRQFRDTLATIMERDTLPSFHNTSSDVVRDTTLPDLFKEYFEACCTIGEIFEEVAARDSLISSVQDIRRDTENALSHLQSIITNFCRFGSRHSPGHEATARDHEYYRTTSEDST